MSSELIRIIQREALQNAIDELEDFIFQLKTFNGDKSDPEEVLDKLIAIRKSIWLTNKVNGGVHINLLYHNFSKSKGEI